MSQRWTPEDVEAYNARRAASKGRVAPKAESSSGGESVQAAAIPEKRRGVQNKLESRYERDVLIPLRAAGEIEDYKFEAVKVRLASGAYYCPDFAIFHKDGRVELAEIKGHWREASRLRIKVAAELYPLFTFYAVRYVGGAWETERF
jgi:hypothetical protein